MHQWKFVQASEGLGGTKGKHYVRLEWHSLWFTCSLPRDHLVIQKIKIEEQCAFWAKHTTWNDKAKLCHTHPIQHWNLRGHALHQFPQWVTHKGGAAFRIPNAANNGSSFFGMIIYNWPNAFPFTFECNVIISLTPAFNYCIPTYVPFSNCKWDVLAQWQSKHYVYVTISRMKKLCSQ